MISIPELKEKIASHPFFMSPFYLKHRHLIMPGIVFGVALLISGLVTIPQVFKLFENFRTINELNEKKTFFQVKNATLAGIDLDLYRKNLDTALLALPADRDIPGVTGELLVALSGSGMTLNGIGFSGSPLEGNIVQEYSLKFDVSGQESNLKNFLERVKLTPRIIKMTTIDVGKGRNNSVTASINFVTLYQELPKDIGSIDEKVPEITAEDNRVLAEIQEKVEAMPQVAVQTGTTPVSGKLNPFAN